KRRSKFGEGHALGEGFLVAEPPLLQQRVEILLASVVLEPRFGYLDTAAGELNRVPVFSGVPARNSKNQADTTSVVRIADEHLRFKERFRRFHMLLSASLTPESN